MKRVVRPGGRIIVRDAVYRRLGNAEQKAVTRTRRRHAGLRDEGLASTILTVTTACADEVIALFKSHRGWL